MMNKMADSIWLLNRSCRRLSTVDETLAYSIHEQRRVIYISIIHNKNVQRYSNKFQSMNWVSRSQETYQGEN